MPEHNDGIDAGAALVVAIHTLGRRPDFEAISSRERVHDFAGRFGNHPEMLRVSVGAEPWEDLEGTFAAGLEQA
jgi:hypothetical protein